MALTTTQINRTAQAKIIVQIKFDNKSKTYRFYASRKDAFYLANQAKQMHGLDAEISKFQINGIKVNLN